MSVPLHSIYIHPAALLPALAFVTAIRPAASGGSVRWCKATTVHRRIKLPEAAGLVTRSNAKAASEAAVQAARLQCVCIYCAKTHTQRIHVFTRSVRTSFMHCVDVHHIKGIAAGRGRPSLAKTLAFQQCVAIECFVLQGRRTAHVLMTQQHWKTDCHKQSKTPNHLKY